MNIKQEGYIELDGELVIIAAYKAYLFAQEQDEKNTLRVKEIKNEQEASSYYWRNTAYEDFKEGVEKSKVTIIKKQEIEKGWFFNKRTEYIETKEEVVDKSKLLEYLKSKNEDWDDITVSAEVRSMEVKENGARFFGMMGIKHKQDYHKYLYNHSLFLPYFNEAYYYQQFFDLKGKVFLTLEQYHKLKEWM